MLNDFNIKAFYNTESITNNIWHDSDFCIHCLFYLKIIQQGSRCGVVTIEKGYLDGLFSLLKSKVMKSMLN
jgi:hypothetical protein